MAAVGYGVAGCPCLIPDVVRRAGGLVLDRGGGVGRCGLDRLGCLLCWVLEAGRGVLGRAGEGWRGGFFDLYRRMLLGTAGQQGEPASQPTPTAIRPTASGLPVTSRRRRSGAADAFS